MPNNARHFSRYILNPGKSALIPVWLKNLGFRAVKFECEGYPLFTRYSSALRNGRLVSGKWRYHELNTNKLYKPSLSP